MEKKKSPNPKNRMTLKMKTWLTVSKTLLKSINKTLTQNHLSIINSILT